MKNAIFLLCTVALVGLAAPAVRALEMPVQIPVVTADSESFELVGRLEAEGLVIFVDRAASNQPVLNASLEVEQVGQKAIASFRPASGDYLIADAKWLKPLRQPGEYALAFTLQAGDEADLLAADFVVFGPATVAVEWSLGGLAKLLQWGGVLFILGGMTFWWRGRKAGKRSAA